MFFSNKNFKQALHHRLIRQKFTDGLNLVKKAWLESYIEKNTDLRKISKNNLEKDFFKLMNNAAFGKAIRHARKYRDIELLTTKRRRNYLVSERIDHTKKLFSENLLAIEMKK